MPNGKLYQIVCARRVMCEARIAREVNCVECMYGRYNPLDRKTSVSDYIPKQEEQKLTDEVIEKSEENKENQKNTDA